MTTKDTQYFAKHVTKMLNISNRTLCRYSVFLEKYGYYFGRNKYKHRIYFSKDISLLNEIHKRVTTYNVTAEEAIADIIKGKTEINTQETSFTQLVLPLLNNVEDSVQKSVDTQFNLNTDNSLQIKVGKASIEVKPGFDPEFVRDVVKALSINE